MGSDIEEDKPCTCERRGPHRLPNPTCPSHGMPEDRGEFGMTTIGSGRVRVEGQSEFDKIDLHGQCVQLTVKPTTHEGIRIVGQWLPEIIERFLTNNTKYARAQNVDLGAKGIIPDVNRKTSVLVDRLWFDAPVVGEPTVEVIDDLIGHLLLMRDKLTNQD